MDFRLSGLDPLPFTHLFKLDDAALAEGIRELVERRAVWPQAAEQVSLRHPLFVDAIRRSMTPVEKFSMTTSPLAINCRARSRARSSLRFSVMLRLPG